MKGMTIMYEHRAKKWGVAISLVGLLLLVAEKVHPFSLMQKYTPVQHTAAFQWFMLLGLFCVIYSKEKYDDDRAKAIRLKAMQIAFMMQTGVTLSTALVGYFIKDAAAIPPGLLFLIAALGAFTYLLVFHFGLYFDEHWDYEDRSLWNNLRNIGRNKWGMLLYLAIGAVVMLLISLMGIVTE